MADTIVLMNYDVLVNNRMSYSPCIELGTKDSYGLEQIKIIRGEGWTELEVLAVFHTPGGAAIKKTVGADGGGCGVCVYAGHGYERRAKRF